MKNSILFLMKSKIDLNIKGINIDRFIKRLKSNNIEIIRLKYISNEEINIRIYKFDYDKLLKLKTIYEVTIVRLLGLVSIKDKIKFNKVLIILIFFSLGVIYSFSNMIFDIDIITNDSDMSNTLLNELNNLGIKKYSFQKSYNRIQEIKKIILSNYKDKIEWIEIESIGTKYIIRYEPRIKNDIKEIKKYRNIVAKKDCIIKSFNVSEGSIVKEINTFVKKGDIIVSGYIDLNGNIKDTVSSSGTVYGETWYKVSVTYPYSYKEVKETGNKNNVFAIKLLNKSIEILNFNKFDTKNIKEKTIIKNNLLPIKLVFQKQRETSIIDENNTLNDVINKATIIAKNKIESNLGENEYISNYKVLSMIKNDNSATLNIFFSVIEDVTDYQEIEKFENTSE